MEKILYTRWKVSVHHFPNSQTFARKQPIINLLHPNLSKALTHSEIIPFYFQQRKKSRNCINTQSTKDLNPTHSNTNLLHSKTTRSFTFSCIYSKPPTSSNNFVNSKRGCSMLLNTSNTRCNLY